MANKTLGYSLPGNNPAYKLYRVSGWMRENRMLEYLMCIRVDPRRLYFQPVSENPKKKGFLSKTVEDMPLDRLIEWAVTNAVQFRVVEVKLKGDDYTTVTIVFKV
jgi:hypothetical protein